MRKSLNGSRKGFTLIELLIVIAVIAILAAIAIPNLLASRKAANESTAISNLRTLVSAQETFRSRANPPTYADLEDLQDKGLIDEVLEAAVDADNAKSGYYYTVSPDDNTFTILATPASDNTGDRHFFVDQSGVIRAEDGTAADEDSPPIQ